jgi:small subunit ribosomal protein S13
MDPLRWLQVEADLKREKCENIGNQRMIGSYVGKRHAMGLPVRGQNTQTNVRTARKLNRVERHT